MTQIKVFKEVSCYEVEKMVNDWLSENYETITVKDIRWTMVNGDISKHLAIVVYEIN